MKVAILILAHKNLDQLKLLVDHLKQDFEVYVHVNKHVSHNLPDEKSVHFIKERYHPYWGSDRTPRAMLALLKEAYNDNCDYYMFISGQDLPLMNNKEMIRRISNEPVNYMHVDKLPRKQWPGNGGLDRVTLFWDVKYESHKLLNKTLVFPLKAGFALLREFQKFFGLRRSLSFPVWGGSMWHNLNRDAVSYILNFTGQNEWFLRRFRHTRVCDELFFQTILMSFDYQNKHTIVNDDMRYVDWTSGPPYPIILRMADYEKCMGSGKFFGRKFDSGTDMSVITKILEATSTPR